MTTLFLFSVLFISMFIGVPIALSLGIASVSTLLLFSSDSLASLVGKFAETMTKHHTLKAIPFFILAGAFMTTGGIARRMINFAIACVGHFSGGLAIASVFACMLFAAVSGSSPATVAAVGSIVIAGMVRSGYTQEFATGVICNSGTLGILIPPSIIMVVYAAATESSVGRMFLAGIIPGITLGLMLMIAVFIRAKKLKLPRQPRASIKEILRTALEASWGLILIVIIIGGIYGGIFTPTEAAAVSAVYACVITLCVYQDLSIKDIPRILLESGRVTLMLFFIIANAMLFAHVLTTEQIPQTIARTIAESGMSWWQFLLVINIVLLIAGNFMEPSAIILILAPIIFPIAIDLNIDPIHLGIIMVVNMEIGLVTPPVGLNLFVASGITGMSMTQVIRAALPWLLILLLFLVLITYIPIISTLIPDTLYGVQNLELLKQMTF